MASAEKEKINGETIVGIALVFLGLLFMWAGTMNPAWASIFIADYILIAIGAGFLALGIVSISRNNKARTHSEEHSGHHY